MSIKSLLKESYAFTKSSTGYDPSKPGAIREVLCNDDAFGMYKQSLAEGLSSEDKKGFELLAENTRIQLLENSTYSLNPYETLALPLLRVFYPKTIAKDLVTVIPMNKPEIIRGFIKASFKRFGDANTYMAPSNTDITSGPRVTVPVTSMEGVGTIDILKKAGLNPEIAHIEKNFMITAVVLDGETVNCNVTPTVDGTLAATVTKADGSLTDTLTGRIDYLKGILEVTSVSNKITAVAFKAQVSLEENTINPRASFSIEKIRLIAQDRQISTDWTIQMQQDIKALYDIELQSELVSAMGQQIVLDVDRQIVNNLIYACERMNGPTHNRTFNKNPSQWEAETGSKFAYGPKQWMENVLPVLNDLSAAIYVDTNIAAGNILACNPLDATIFESLQEFRYNGSSSEDGDLGYRSAEVAGGKWKVLVSPVVPQGKSLCLYKPTEQIKCTYIFAPYVPCVLTPYPLGNTPSMTILSRNGEQLIRPAGISVLNITDKKVTA
jgi:hypothetical protein